MMSIESFAPTAATMGGGFFVGILIGYALKKVIKLLAVIVGLFFAGLAYLQYHQIANVNWSKLQTVSENAITTLSNALLQLPGISGGSVDVHNVATACTRQSLAILRLVLYQYFSHSPIQCMDSSPQTV